MTNELNAPTGATPQLPPVEVDIQSDFIADSRFARAYQRWIAPEGFEERPLPLHTFADIPIRLYGSPIMEPHEARAIAVAVMNAQARGFLACGYRLRAPGLEGTGTMPGYGKTGKDDLDPLR